MISDPTNSNLKGFFGTDFLGEIENGSEDFLMTFSFEGDDFTLEVLIFLDFGALEVESSSSASASSAEDNSDSTSSFAFDRSVISTSSVLISVEAKEFLVDLLLVVLEVLVSELMLGSNNFRFLFDLLVDGVGI